MTGSNVKLASGVIAFVARAVKAMLKPFQGRAGLYSDICFVQGCQDHADSR